jgi:hypothetical protein
MTRLRIALVAIAALCASLLGVGAAGDARAVTFRWAADTDPGSMDPHSRNVAATLSFLSNIDEGLVRRDRDLKLEPALALSWTTTGPDTWRFVLRRNVRFHDGSPFTADDVVFSYERARGPGSLMATSFATVRELRKVDDFTVDIVTNGPDPILPDEISTWLIMSRRWAEQNNATRATDLTRNEQSFASINANGTGPFRLRSRTPDGRTELVNNAEWWDTATHNLTEVIFTPLANPATRTAAGYRIFDDSTLARLAFIARAKQLGRVRVDEQFGVQPQLPRHPHALVPDDVTQLGFQIPFGGHPEHGVGGFEPDQAAAGEDLVADARCRVEAHDRLKMRDHRGVGQQPVELEIRQRVIVHIDFDGGQTGLMGGRGDGVVRRMHGKDSGPELEHVARLDPWAGQADGVVRQDLLRERHGMGSRGVSGHLFVSLSQRCERSDLSHFTTPRRDEAGDTSTARRLRVKR